MKSSMPPVITINIPPINPRVGTMPPGFAIGGRGVFVGGIGVIVAVGIRVAVAVGAILAVG